MFLTTTLAAGSYTVNLQPGWALERTDTAQVVDAALTSPNPAAVQILASSTTRVSYSFSTSGGPVTIGEGSLNIAIDVTINADGGAPGCSQTPDNCGAGFVCEAFGSGNICVRTCDPVTQLRSDGAPACGSPNPSSPTLGCYGVDDRYTCAPAGNATKTHGVPAADAGGTVFLNSCAPGYQPMFRASSTDSTVLCTAYCLPAVTNQSSPANANGVSPYSCANRGAPAGTECRFLSWATGTPSARSNSIGVCFEHADFTYDHDSNPTTPNVPTPSCTALSSTDADANGIADYLEWGCGPLP